MGRGKHKYRESTKYGYDLGPSRKKIAIETSSTTENASDDAGAEESGLRIHVPKTKYAIAFGYLGSNYHGYQMQCGSNTPVETIEGRLMDALVAVGCIHESHRNLLGKLQLSKASRTDKGVHAACTYVGGRFELSNFSDGEPSLSREEALAAKLNELLPKDIRCYRVLRVTRGFCARSMCSKRTYEYMIPRSLLTKKYILDDDFKREKFKELTEIIESNMASKEPISVTRQGTSDGYNASLEEREMDLELLQEILKDYSGSHDFRNFTPRQKTAENTTQRFIHEIKVEKRCMSEGAEEVVSIVITGQSFLYNQIRKMISLAYEVYLGTAPRNSVKFALHKKRSLQTAIAPAEGLFLHHPYFEAYNKRCNPPQTPMIDFEDIQAMVEDFKIRQIYPTILKSFDSDIWDIWLSRIARNPFYLENHGLSVSGEGIYDNDGEGTTL
ncbi:pseudouridylate synthase like protein [Babesia gibsoni]|uniref:Pseudouridylate synthase like protein n=1 Tax=Babesia gibsoni TaxID=33632 RepID=A0AAD8LJ63_BABGI|nr:pseudouridylate synthase like protein [Babesia gibsoni]